MPRERAFRSAARERVVVVVVVVVVVARKGVVGGVDTRDFFHVRLQRSTASALRC
jgi:hypothetical protein